MYLWNVEKLIEHLKKNTLAQWEVYAFYILSPLVSLFNSLFFAFLLLSHHFIGNFFAHFLSKQHPQMSYYALIAVGTSAATIIISLCGMYLCYKANQSGDNKDFRTRMACLSFTVNFHLTIYVLAFVAFIVFIGYLTLHGKIILFKKSTLSLTAHDKTIGAAIKQTLSDSSPMLKKILPKAQKATGLIKGILKTPVTVLSLPSIPGKINGFLSDLRATVLSFYPFIALLPPTLSLLHYFLVRRMLKKITQP